MYIDGKESPYFRANYVLRAAQIPVGNHKIEFIFHPASYYTGEKISLAGSILLVLALGGAIYTDRVNTPWALGILVASYPIFRAVKLLSNRVASA